MTLQDYLKLRNGSGVRGIATENDENQTVTLTQEVAENIAKAFCVWLITRTGKTQVRVAVGYDSRISSPTLCDGVVNGIISTGHNVVVTGLSTTPSMFMLLKDSTVQPERYVHGAIMITASHLPYYYNGLKFFSQTGALEPSDVKEILEIAATFRFAETTTFGQRVDLPYLDTYALSLVEKVRAETGEETPLAGKRILVDAGNGACGFFADKVLIPLGANVEGSQFLQPDGYFPNHIPNPENEDAMQSLCKAVLGAKADFGFIFDGDANRVGVVDENGQAIHKNRFIALICAILLSEKAGTIVTDSVTSDGLTRFIEKRKGKHVRFKCGYKNVIDEAIRRNETGEYCPLAIETSRHTALFENYFISDGAYLATRLLTAMAKQNASGKTLSDLIADLDEPFESLEVRLSFANDCDFKALSKQALEEFEKYANGLYYANPDKENYDGIRLCFDELHGNGFALVRPSLHEPVLIVHFESESENGVVKMVKDLFYALRHNAFLDVSPLENYVKAWRENKVQTLKAKFARELSVQI